MTNTTLRSSVSLVAMIAAVSAVFAQAASAQSADPVDGVLACRNIDDVNARLACFDAAADRLASARETGDVVTVTREDVEAVERDSFGFDLPSLPRFRLPAFRTQAAERQADVHDALEGEVSAGEPTAHTPATVAADAGNVQPPAETAAPEPANETPQAEETVQILERDQDGDVHRVSMIIERTRVVGYDTTVFYMENGQVWRQIDTRRIRVPRNRENTAEIRRGAMGSYLLRINGEGRAIRVRRER